MQLHPERGVIITCESNSSANIRVSGGRGGGASGAGAKVPLQPVVLTW